MYDCIIKTAFVLFLAIQIINCEQEETRSLKPVSRNQLLLAKLDRLSKKLQASKTAPVYDLESSDDFNYLLDGSSSLFDKLNANQRIKFNSNNDHLAVMPAARGGEDENDESSQEASIVDFRVNRFDPYDLYFKKALSVHQPHAMRMNSLKRSYVGYFPASSESVADRLIKGKRVNRNMFSSGLQGVWGVPGR